MKKAKLLPFQAAGVRRISYFGGRCLIADEMGLGKTFQSLAWTARHEKYPLLIVCPAILKINWQRECWDKIRAMATVLYGLKPPRLGSNEAKQILSSPILIINYDILYRWTKFLKNYAPQTLILDECHRIKNGKTKRSRACHRVGRITPSILALSGSPVFNRPIELYSVLHLLKPHVFRSKVEFGYEYCAPEVNLGRVEFRGCSNPRKLNRLLKRHVMLRRLKKNVLHEFPQKTRTIVPLELPPAGWKEYLAAATDILQYIQDTQGPDARKKAKKAETLVRLASLKEIVARHKLPQVMDWMDLFLESGQKLVMFCVHRKIAQQLYERYPKSAVVVNGSITGRRRQAAVDAFQNNPKTRLLIGNLEAAGVGLNLTRASSVAFCELGWTPPEHVQAEDRVHRIGQHLPCWAYYLIAVNTIEVIIAKMLQTKQNNIETIMDGQPTREMALVDLLKTELERLHGKAS